MTALNVMGQTVQPCIVEQYNHSKPKTPLPGVEVTVANAGSQVSGVDGTLTLTFRTLKAGDKVTLISAKKAGYELFNKSVVEQWRISSDKTPFPLVFVRSDSFTEQKQRLTEVSNEVYKAKYLEQLKQIETMKKEGKLKEEEYNNRLEQIERHYTRALRRLDTYIDQFARIDMSVVSDEERRILEMVEEGQIEKAVEAYELLNISDKLKQARKNMQALNEADARIQAEKAKQKQAIEDLEMGQKREIATLTLAGGRKNIEKVRKIMRENALADTTDFVPMFEYARFLFHLGRFDESEKIYRMCLNASQDNPMQQAITLNSIGLIHMDQRQYSEAEHWLLKSLKIKRELAREDSAAYREELVKTLNNLGILYRTTQKYELAETYFLKALNIQTALVEDDPEPHRYVLASIQTNLGNLYVDYQKPEKMEKYYYSAYGNYLQCYRHDSVKYLPSLALIQNNLSNCYTIIGKYDKAEELLFKALESRTKLYVKYPQLYSVQMATTLANAGAHYYRKHQYDKAEEYFLREVKICNSLFKQNPKAHRNKLFDALHQLHKVYANTNQNAKAIAVYDKMQEHMAILGDANRDLHKETYSNIYERNARVYAHLDRLPEALEAVEQAIDLNPKNPNAYDTKGMILYKMGDHKAAHKLWKKVLDLDPTFQETADPPSELWEMIK
jgi:tetratricopeptide (TPR) repeat protein